MRVLENIRLLRRGWPLLLMAGSSLFAESINLTVPKGRVLPMDRREAVLKVAKLHLGNLDRSETWSANQELQSPFAFKVDKPTEAEVTEVIEDQPKKKKVYTKQAILALAASKITPQIRATLSKSGQDYIQLKNGNLMKAGAVIPLRVPEIREKPYDIQIKEISESNYTLNLGDVDQTFNYTGSLSSNNSGVEVYKQNESEETVED